MCLQLLYQCKLFIVGQSIGDIARLMIGRPHSPTVAITVSEKFEKNFLHTLTMGNMAQKGSVYGMLL